VIFAPFGYLTAWARVRRITAGRHTVPGSNVIRYTTLEAVRADFGDRSGAYERALSLWEPRAGA
jgi:hypothetical protein